MKPRLATAFFALGLAIGICAPGAGGSPPSDRPNGWSHTSYYLSMRDGVRLAVSIYFPDGKPPERKAPVLLIQTRYGRAGMLPYAAPWLARGYVVAAVDTRGSTASFGSRPFELTPEEMEDMDELIAHLAVAPWSNGQVVASGVSYMADTADVAASRPTPALVAVIPRQVDFDAYAHLFFPGGVSNAYMLREWGTATRELDLGRDGRGRGLDCVERVTDCHKLFPLLQPVDGDEDYTLLRQAIKGRHRWTPEDYAEASFRDDPGKNGYRLFDASSGSQLAGIRRQRIPTQYWGSWLDAGTAEAALARFRSAPEVPIEVWITANDHMHQKGADPFRPADSDPVPSVSEQERINIDFADNVRAGRLPLRRIHYYVLGAGVMKTTRSWPPEGAQETTFLLSADGGLSSARSRSGISVHKVDFTATTGRATRWTTNFGVSPAYPDRREADRKLAVWQSAPHSANFELAGTPVITLNMATTSADPAIFVYLEDVAPDGRVTYLTEGQLRLIHRKIADPQDLPYDQGPAPHSFRRADALAVVPGREMNVRLALFPVAAKLAKGHRLRVAIGGADADTFRRYSEGKAETFRIRHGGVNASRLELPLRPWQD